MPATYGLIDANSLYCSCERAFDPRLRGVPVVVLSNNDGCAIARTSESKARGVKMGDPWHLVRGRDGCEDIVWMSSNYSHYGDLSRRMYEVLAARVPRVEPYSIDEMFLDLDVPAPDLVAFCRGLRDAVRREAKLPACVGLGPTKTIAKLANAVAKDRPELDGVCDLRGRDARKALYRELPAAEAWGIGGQNAAKLARLGVGTLAEFVALDPRLVRASLTVVGARVQAELRGLSCLPLTLAVPARKGLAVTRCFGRLITSWAELREAVAAYAARVGEKLRGQRLVARAMTVFAHTHPHNGDPWHNVQHTGRIEATADSRALVAEAVRMLRPLWRPGLRWFKAGVMLSDLAPAAAQPRMLFATRDLARSARVMAALDAINARHGRDALRIAATGLERGWGTRHHRLSPRYTTRAAEMLVAQAW